MAEVDGDGAAAELVISTHREPGGEPVITLSGELDISSADSLEQTVTSLAAAGPSQLIFDLRALSFMDSAGIAVLVGAAKKVDTVKLRDPSVIVRRVIELTGLTDILAIES